MMPPLISPLRYPGSKAGLVEYVAMVINENMLTGCRFYECHAGGASLGLGLLSRGLISRLTLIEKDPLLYAFWKSVVVDPERLCQKIRELQVTLATWNHFQKYRSTDALKRFEILDLGVAALFFNRTNFSGVLSAGPIGGMNQKSEYAIACRFNKDVIIERILAIGARRTEFSVVHCDAVTYLQRREHRFANEALIYLDPPYYSQGPRLYRYSYSKRQHRRLATYICAQAFSWLVSYDRHPSIEALFHGQRIVPITLNYAVKQARRAEELLISNLPLPEPVYTDKDGRRNFSAKAA
jgi:DNA adenine methylase